MTLLLITMLVLSSVSVFARGEEAGIPETLEYVIYNEGGSVAETGIIHNDYFQDKARINWPAGMNLLSGQSIEFRNPNGMSISANQSVTVVYFLNQSATTYSGVRTSGGSTVVSNTSYSKTVSYTKRAITSGNNCYVFVKNAGSWNVTLSNVSIGWS